MPCAKYVCATCGTLCETLLHKGSLFFSIIRFELKELAQQQLRDEVPSPTTKRVATTSLGHYIMHDIMPHGSCGRGDGYTFLVDITCG